MSESSGDERPYAVIDNGTGFIKAGLNGEDAPKVTFATVVGYDSRFTPKMRRAERAYYVGEMAVRNHSTCSLNRTMTVHDEIIRCAELMFDPSLDGLALPGLHTLVMNSVKEGSHPDAFRRVDMLTNIILAGGNTMFGNMAERLESEVQKLCPPDMRTRVIAPPERFISSWIGGSILASLSRFPSLCISRDRYDEVGAKGLNEMLEYRDVLRT